MGSMNYMGLNTYEKPFSDVKVRQAINHAINRPLINKALFNDKAILCAGPISPRTMGADPALKPYAYDPALAKKLLAEAGYPDGFETRLAYGTYLPQIQEQAEVIASDLAKIGVKVTLEPFRTGRHVGPVQEQTASDVHLFLGRCPGAGPLHVFSVSLQGRDYYYKNETVDQLLDKGRSTTDPAARVKVYNELDKYLYKDARGSISM